MRGGALGVAFAWILVTWPSYTYSDGEASREYAEAPVGGAVFQSAVAL